MKVLCTFVLIALFPLAANGDDQKLRYQPKVSPNTPSASRPGTRDRGGRHDHNGYHDGYHDGYRGKRGRGGRRPFVVQPILPVYPGGYSVYGGQYPYGNLTPYRGIYGGGFYSGYSYGGTAATFGPGFNAGFNGGFQNGFGGGFGPGFNNGTIIGGLNPPVFGGVTPPINPGFNAGPGPALGLGGGGGGGINPGLAAPPQSRILETDFSPNPALPPVTAEFRNNGSRPLRVAILDRFEQEPPLILDLAPGEVRPVEVQRDGGGLKISRVETHDYYGNSSFRTIKTKILARTRYDVVVHRWDIQSLAIDRTAPEGEQIEDINRTGVPLGWFSIPAGDEYRGGRINVLTVARRQNNADDLVSIAAAEDDPRMLLPGWQPDPLLRAAEETLRD